MSTLASLTSHSLTSTDVNKVLGADQAQYLSPKNNPTFSGTTKGILKSYNHIYAGNISQIIYDVVLLDDIISCDIEEDASITINLGNITTDLPYGKELTICNNSTSGKVSYNDVVDETLPIGITYFILGSNLNDKYWFKK